MKFYIYIIFIVFLAFRLDLLWLPLNLLETVCTALAHCIYNRGVGYRWEMRGVDVEGNTGRNQTFTVMFRTPHCMKLYHNVSFMVSFRREKGSSLTGTYFVIKVHFKYVHEHIHGYVWSFILSTL